MIHPSKKNILILMSLLLLMFIIGCYIFENPLTPVDSDSGYNYHAIDFIDTYQGWAVGEKGSIFHTSSGGMAWSKQESGTNADLVKVQFVDEDYGWIAGGGTILHTNNGGLSWSEQIADGKLSKWVISMCFVNRSKGWVRGPTEGAIYYTTNGGETWDIQETGLGMVIDIFFVNESIGYLIQAHGCNVYKKTDGGIHWHELSGPIRSQSIYFLDTQTGFVGTTNASSSEHDKASIFRTDDGGDTWIEQEIPQPSKQPVFVWKVAFANSECGLAIAGSFKNTVKGGSLLYTKDGGNTWSKVENLLEDYFIADFSLLDEDNIWALSSNGVVIKLNLY